MKAFSQLTADILQAEAIKDAMTYDMPSTTFKAMTKAYFNLLDAAEEQVSDLPELEDRQVIRSLLWDVRHKVIKENFTFKNR